MWGDVLALVLVPCCAGFVFVGMHTWLGLQVIRRNIIFADLALAQLSALGAIIGVSVGHPVGSPACFVYALVTTLLGAALLTGLRMRVPSVVCAAAASNGAAVCACKTPRLVRRPRSRSVFIGDDAGCRIQAARSKGKPGGGADLPPAAPALPALCENAQE